MLQILILFFGGKTGTIGGAFGVGTDIATDRVEFIGWGADFTFGSRLPTGSWWHIVIAYNGATVFPYINGVLKLPAGSNVTLSTVTGSIRLGFRPDGNAATRLQGGVDEVGVWNRCLGSDEVVQLFNNGLGLTYPFNITKVSSTRCYVRT